jgi:broad-specificity NMP kinase
MENRGWVDRKINSNIAAFLHKVFASRRDFYPAASWVKLS